MRAVRQHLVHRVDLALLMNVLMAVVIAEALGPGGETVTLTGFEPVVAFNVSVTPGIALVTCCGQRGPRCSSWCSSPRRRGSWFELIWLTNCLIVVPAANAHLLAVDRDRVGGGGTCEVERSLGGARQLPDRNRAASDHGARAGERGRRHDHRVARIDRPGVGEQRRIPEGLRERRLDALELRLERVQPVLSFCRW
jgi:hypothetical protein